MLIYTRRGGEEVTYETLVFEDEIYSLVLQVELLNNDVVIQG